MNNILHKLIKIRLTIVLVVGITIGCWQPIIVKLQGTLFSVRTIAILTVIYEVIGLMQGMLNKLNFKYSLTLPVIFDIVGIPIVLGIMSFETKMYLVVIIIRESIAGLLYTNRSNRITELLNEKYPMHKYMNNAITTNSIGMIIGTFISYLFSEYNMKTVLIILYISNLCILVPIEIYVNYLVKTSS